MTETATAGTGAETATATDAAAGTSTTGAAGQGAAGQSGGETLESLKAQLAAAQADADKWKTMSRTNEKSRGAAQTELNQQKDLLAKIAAKVGLDLETPDPAALEAKLEAAQQENTSRLRELAVLRAAARLGANGDELLDSRQFLAGIDKLDPTDAEGLTAAIKAAVAAAPTKFGSSGAAAAAQAQQGGAQHQASTTASGAQFNGASGGQRQWTKADVERATPAELTKAMAAGLVDSYLAS
jgi:hypothetical protein